ncbi:MAG: dolichyl-phosphate-mannose--protein mannosyltransferase, partial [Actinomyces sp. oral taxon 181]|nr:dolichyl-phosphate-mannose--protein mannosyltransferase [Actinomyces sp. oral taxon 181]
MDDKTLSDSDIPEDPALGSDQASPAVEPEPLPESEEGKPSPSTEVNEASTEVNKASADDEEADATPEETGREWKPVPIPRWARFPMSAQAGWVATLVTTLVAALIRLPGLG